MSTQVAERLRELGVTTLSEPADSGYDAPAASGTATSTAARR